MSFKTGFIAVIGRPNVGKSSLVNKIVGAKVSIVTNKAQTTRNNIRGIVTKKNEYQLIFIDTPGIHTPKQELDKFMNSSAFRSTKEADLVLFLVPADENIGKNDLLILKDLQRKTVPKFLVVTKNDLVSKEIMAKKLLEWSQISNNIFDEIIPISLEYSKALENLEKLMVEYLPESDYHFFEDNQNTDQPFRFSIKEIIRENILIKAGQEIPHSIAILIDEIHDTEQMLTIMATIIVERKSQKGIIIGKNGSKIKDIKYKSRKQLKELTNKNIKLELFVKVQEKWRNSPSLIKKMGYNKDKY